ncbi:MAG: TIGR03905 family TSCPD domain-containing protein [Bacteroidales bacterium]|nr:TIGR03905 family TSCPD domain-containing protein [Bacteroidales bacterium]
MTKKFTFQTSGTCSKEIEFILEDNIVKDVSFFGGCNGNLKGICKLIDGMNADMVIEKLKGIDCKGKGTSCPDQLTKALKLALKQNN